MHISPQSKWGPFFLVSERGTDLRTGGQESDWCISPQSKMGQTMRECPQGPTVPLGLGCTPHSLIREILPIQEEIL